MARNLTWADAHPKVVKLQPSSFGAVGDDASVYHWASWQRVFRQKHESVAVIGRFMFGASNLCSAVGHPVFVSCSELRHARQACARTHAHHVCAFQVLMHACCNRRISVAFVLCRSKPASTQFVRHWSARIIFT